MRDRIIIIAGLLFIAACAIFTVTRIDSAYRGPVVPADFTPAPLVPASPTATASATAAEPASTAPAPRHTVTVTVTITPPPATGEAGP
jgi:hypothetical protein